MKTPLSILHLEDHTKRRVLVQPMLEGNGIPCSITRVSGRAALVAALENGGVDLVLADSSLPSFNGLAALKIVRERWPDLPCILVLGSLNEELAMECFHQGATECILKARLWRLVPAVHRAMQQVEERCERGRLEEQAIQAQKMEMFGHLAGGVVHDFNNILAVILGHSEIVLADLGPDHPLFQDAEQIKQAAERAATLTRQLLLFSRNETVAPVVLDLNEAVASTEKMLRRLINENVELIVHSGEQLGRVVADPGYVQQLIMNLVINARDAMPNGGSVRIETSNVTLEESCPTTDGDLVPGRYVLLAVADTGTGMTDEVKARLFEAFFTTKPKNSGTGLGLATCHTIVKSAGGHIVVESELGKGTTFKVYLPQVDLPLDASTPSIWEGPLPRGSETVLVVEDDAAVRHLTLGILRAQGYEVFSASNGQNGLNLARQHRGEPIRLVLTDVIMPKMPGDVMADWLKTAYPDVKVLYTSGYTDDVIAQHGVLDPGVAFLPKPYTPATITRKVRQILDG
jgi:two-component system cell cycle sensor histidine kinase/response regulator CckA